MSTAEVIDATWLSIRVQQMLNCRHTLVELVEEIQEAGGAAAQRLTDSWLAAFVGRHGPEVERAVDALYELLASQAVQRARGEWRRMQMEAA